MSHNKLIVFKKANCHYAYYMALFQLPLSEQTLALYTEEAAHMNKIMVVSDDETLLKQVRELEEDTHSVSTTEQLRAEERHVDIGLFDLTTSLENPMQTFEMLKEMVSKILILVDIDNAGEVETYLEAGAVDFIQKPLAPALLKKRLEHIEAYHESLEKNESYGQIIGFTAHELKNPLVSLEGYASLIFSPMGDDLSINQIKRFARIIKDNAEQMRKTVDDMRDLVLFEDGQFSLSKRPLSIKDVIETAQLPLQGLVESKKQTLTLNIPENIPDAEADEVRMVQAITNLLYNAIRYTPEGGEITLFAAEIDHDGERSVRIGVADTSIGMSQADWKRIWQKPQIGDKPVPHGEISLRLIRHITEAHNGTFTLHSEIGNGATFAIVLPLGNTAQADDRPTTPSLAGNTEGLGG